MVQLAFVCPIFLLLDEGSIVVLGAVVEQSPCLVKLKSSMALVVVLQGVHSEETLQVYLVLLQWWVQIGLGGLVGSWTSLTRSNPDESDSLPDLRNWWSLNGARSGCASIISFAGKQVSSNFTSWEISKHQWAVSQNIYPLDLSSYLMKIIAWLFGSSLYLLFFRMCTQARHPKTHRCEMFGLMPDQSSFRVL